jgi:tRNA modification GTPase
MRSPGNDTIAAVATARGAGGIGIVRISGPDALAVAGRFFRGRGGGSLDVVPPFRMLLGFAADPASGERIDEVFAVWMPEARSYTGEPTVEIHAHGGCAVPDAILHAALKAGARLAAPGEFTKRAFLGGRMDLSQAEAVAELIGAETEDARRFALLQLEGGLAARVRELRQRVLDLVAGAEALLDFGDEEGEGVEPTAPLLGSLAASMRDLAGEGTARLARSHGVKVVIAGRTNSGKSSIFNMLLCFSRSIVTPFPGTTRDYIEERTLLGETATILVDTAGLRNSSDPAEAEGVHRSRQQILGADVLLFVIDGSEPAHPEDFRLLDEFLEKSPVVVISKADLPNRLGSHEVRERFGNLPACQLSALTGEGCSQFIEALAVRCRSKQQAEKTLSAAPNLRHQHILLKTAKTLEIAAQRISRGEASLDQTASDLRSALEVLGEITGETATDEIIGRIFSAFCIGK